MKRIDISQEVMSCQVYPGDPAPQMLEEKRICRGDLYNLSSLHMGAHNGTHLDAPFHFLDEGKTIEDIPLEKTVGWCCVTSFDGDMGRADALAILADANAADRDAAKKLLFKGRAIVTAEAARVFAEAALDLIGVTLQSVGPEDAPMEVHKILLAKEVCLLEGLRLDHVEDGVYFLHAAPLSLAGFDGAPCRATLIRF